MHDEFPDELPPVAGGRQLGSAPGAFIRVPGTGGLVALKLPFVSEARPTPDAKHDIQMRKLTERFEAALKAQQAETFQQRLMELQAEAFRRRFEALESENAALRTQIGPHMAVSGVLVPANDVPVQLTWTPAAAPSTSSSGTVTTVSRSSSFRERSAIPQSVREALDLRLTAALPRSTSDFNIKFVPRRNGSGYPAPPTSSTWASGDRNPRSRASSSCGPCAGSCRSRSAATSMSPT